MPSANPTASITSVYAHRRRWWRIGPRRWVAWRYVLDGVFYEHRYAHGWTRAAAVEALTGDAAHLRRLEALGYPTSGPRGGHLREASKAASSAPEMATGRSGRTRTAQPSGPRAVPPTS